MLARTVLAVAMSRGLGETRIPWFAEPEYALLICRPSDNEGDALDHARWITAVLRIRELVPEQQYVSTGGDIVGNRARQINVLIHDLVIIRALGVRERKAPLTLRSAGKYHSIGHLPAGPKKQDGDEPRLTPWSL